MDLLIGCPVSRRGWILPAWLQHAEAAAAHAGVAARYIILADRDDDAWCALAPVADRLSRVEVHDPRRDDLRDWCTPGRVRRITELRNQLLGAVRVESPDVFLSLDSDILMHPHALRNMLETLAGYDAVGGYVYMDDTCASPSWGRVLEGGALDRVDVRGYLGPVEVIMAIKVMNARAYAHDYVDHPKGEDVGICLAWRQAGVRIGLDARVTSKHVMERPFLDRVDERCGF